MRPEVNLPRTSRAWERASELGMPTLNHDKPKVEKTYKNSTVNPSTVKCNQTT
jgi:hypothetical protein